MRGEEREVNIFNMSFLDVLCCTVGALIFILFIQTLRTRDMVERQQLEKTVTKLEDAKAELLRTEQAEEQMREQFRQMKEDFNDVQDNITAAKKEKEELKKEYQAAVDELEQIRITAKKEKEELEEEKKELMEEKNQLVEEKTELAKEKEELESELVVAMDRLEEVREELKERDDTISKLVKELQEPNLPEVAFVDLSAKDPNAIDEAGKSMESQKTAHGQYLLGNLETQSIVCSSEGIYLGMSRRAIPINDNPDLGPLFRQFLRFHDPKQEGLWQTVWGNGEAAANMSMNLRASNRAIIGQGLIPRPEEYRAEAQQKATQEQIEMVALDTDNDGFKETRFEDADGDGRLDLKRVNMDNDEFYEELSLDYNEQRRQWARLLVDTDGDNEYDLLLQDTDPTDSDYEMKYLLPNLQTGSAVFRYEDSNNDGIWDAKEENIDMSNPYWEKRYLLFKPTAQRWEAVSVDANGDGQADILWRDTDMSNDDWEEKYVDEDGDGQWDVYWKDLDPRDNDWEAKLTQFNAENNIWQQCELDTDASGKFDTMLKDTDGDGEWDEETPIVDSDTESTETQTSPEP
ncbi:MAG: hypothetical protein JXM79_17090 [Sedimentisphaerales bacterium]|nr:hypothetical protein [Sedimentisphaerales bacterium]